MSKITVKDFTITTDGATIELNNNLKIIIERWKDLEDENKTLFNDAYLVKGDKKIALDDYIFIDDDLENTIEDIIEAAQNSTEELSKFLEKESKEEEVEISMTRDTEPDVLDEEIDYTLLDVAEYVAERLVCIPKTQPCGDRLRGECSSCEEYLSKRDELYKELVNKKEIEYRKAYIHYYENRERPWMIDGFGETFESFYKAAVQVDEDIKEGIIFKTHEEQELFYDIRSQQVYPEIEKVLEDYLGKDKEDFPIAFKNIFDKYVGSVLENISYDDDWENEMIPAEKLAQDWLKETLQNYPEELRGLAADLSEERKKQYEIENGKLTDKNGCFHVLTKEDKIDLVTSMWHVIQRLNDEDLYYSTLDIYEDGMEDENVEWNLCNINDPKVFDQETFNDYVETFIRVIKQLKINK